MKQAILDHLSPTHPWRTSIQVFDSLDSTNTYAHTLAKSGAPEGTVILARQQTAGRGRLGRSFHSPADSGLYMSLILRPGCAPGALMHLTCAVAVAVCQAMETAVGVRPEIKWINDLVLGGKKLGGILTELGFTPEGTVDYAVIGIGINLCHRSQDFPEELRRLACSVYSQTGKQPELPALAVQLITALEEMNESLLSDKETIMNTYRKNCVTLGRDVKIISPTLTRIGKALDIRDDGALMVAFPDGNREPVFSGEVSVRGLWDYV